MSNNNDNNNAMSNKPVQKRPFLKKGKGLSRFRMTAEDFKLKKKSGNAKKSIKSSQISKSKPKDSTNEQVPFERENVGIFFPGLIC